MPLNFKYGQKYLLGTIILFVFIHQPNKLHIKKEAHKVPILQLNLRLFLMMKLPLTVLKSAHPGVSSAMLGTIEVSEF